MRVKFLQQALEINEVQAEILSDQIKDIPDIKLKDFFVFRQGFVAPMKSKELITKEALYAYREAQYKKQIELGQFSFTDEDQVLDYLQTYYKGKDIGNGLGLFYDYVIIAMDRDGEFINKYAIDEFTQKYRKVDSEDVTRILEDLLANPQKIGSVKKIPYHEPLPAPQEKIEYTGNVSIPLPQIKRF